LKDLGLSDKFVFLYAGNIGHPTDVETIIESAEQLLVHQNIHFLFIGAGVKKKWVEDQLEYLFDFFHSQVEERHWYGFWDFGDIMHNYDFGRHEWRYDVGGWAWANTELMPDLIVMDLSLPLLDGWEAIHKSFDQYFLTQKPSPAKLTDQWIEIRIYGNGAYARFIQRISDEIDVEETSQVRVLEKKDGKWKIVCVSVVAKYPVK